MIHARELDVNYNGDVSNNFLKLIVLYLQWCHKYGNSIERADRLPVLINHQIALEFSEKDIKIKKDYEKHELTGNLDFLSFLSKA